MGVDEQESDQFTWQLKAKNSSMPFHLKLPNPHGLTQKIFSIRIPNGTQRQIICRKQHDESAARNPLCCFK